MSKFVEKLKEYPDYLEFGGVSIEVINKAEQHLGLSFSEEYKEYLLRCGIATANGHEFTGLCSSDRLNVVCVTLAEMNRNGEVIEGAYVIEQTHIDGIVIWQIKRGDIYKSQENTFIKICNSLSEYIDL